MRRPREAAASAVQAVPKNGSHIRKSGAGEGIRTLDPNLGKVKVKR